MTKSTNKISRYFSLILRHKPETIGLELDAEGWADVSDIIEKVNFPLDQKTVEHVVATNDKQRFILSDCGTRIRANQGHSINVDLGLEPIEPPHTLYHGTASRFLGSIWAEGLKPQSRQFVHLSGDLQTAEKVGVRHGKLVVLIVPALDMHKAGHKFYQAKNGVWLTDHVPGRALKLLK